MVKDENYYYVCGWMLRLGLKGFQLPVYAIIYGFSQDGQSEFKGSLTYLAEFANCSRRNVIRTLQQLEELGMIKKRSYNDEVGNTHCFYRAVRPSDIATPGVTPCHRGSDMVSSGVVTPCPMGSDTVAPNNKYIYKEINKEECNVDYSTAFALYEQKIGTIGRTVAERIMAIIDDSGLEAFKKAVGKANTPSKRNINYIDKTANDIAVNGDYDDIAKGSLSELPGTLEEFVAMFGEKRDKDADK